MQTFLFTALIAFALAVLMIIFKAIESKYGIPEFIVNTRSRTDRKVYSLRDKIVHYIKFKAHEMKEALSRTPHLLIHLAYVMKDKLRVYFAHYIDEVKGRKPISNKPTNSTFLSAVKEHKEESDKGEITDESSY